MPAEFFDWKARQIIEAAHGDPDTAGPLAAWAEDVFVRRADELTADNAIDILHEEVGVVFGHVLDNAGVFKWDEAGRAAQQRFIDSL